MTKEHRMTNDEGTASIAQFDIRGSSFSSRSAHPGNLRQSQNPWKNVYRLRVLQFLDRDRAIHREPSRFRSSKILQVRPATERFADVVRVGANVEAFAANHREIDLGRSEPVD